MNAVVIFCLLSVLLVLGKLVRLGVPVLQRLYLPSSVIGGLIGLLVFSCFGQYFPAEAVKAMGKLPGFLINVIFAAIFLGTVAPKLKDVFKNSFSKRLISNKTKIFPNHSESRHHVKS